MEEVIQVYSAVDGFLGYFSILMKDSSILLSTFIVAGIGAFAWKVMPFGLLIYLFILLPALNPKSYGRARVWNAPNRPIHSAYRVLLALTQNL